MTADNPTPKQPDMTAPTAPQGDSDWLDTIFDNLIFVIQSGYWGSDKRIEYKAAIRSRISEAEAAAELKGRRSEAVWWARNCNNPAYAELLAKRLERVQARQADTSGRE